MAHYGGPLLVRDEVETDPMLLAVGPARTPCNLRRSAGQRKNTDVKTRTTVKTHTMIKVIRRKTTIGRFRRGFNPSGCRSVLKSPDSLRASNSAIFCRI